MSGPPAERARDRAPVPSWPAYLVLLALLGGLTFLRCWKLEVDPPQWVAWGYTGQAHYRDEAAKAHEARNKAKWGEWSLSEYDEYAFWRAQSPAWVHGEAKWFELFGVGVLQARMFVVAHTVLALALLMWLALVRHGLPAALASGLLLGLNWPYLVYSRLALMEGALLSWLLVVTAMLSQLQRQPRRTALWAMLATAAMLVACTIKQTALLVVPAFCVTLTLLGLWAAGQVAGLDDAEQPWHRRLLARLRRREAQAALVAVATLALALAMLIFSPEYQERLAFNAEHFTVAREGSVFSRALETFIRGLVSLRIQLMFTHLAPFMLWLATLELARLIYLENRRQRAALRDEPEPPRVGALEGRADPIDLWMFAWAIFGLLANLASPHRAIRFQLIMLPPAAYLGAVLVARIWRHEWPSRALAWGVRAGLGVIVLLGSYSTLRSFHSWTSSRKPTFVWVADELEALIGEREAVVVGEFAAQAVFETDYRHFYVRPDQFNFTPEILRGLGITHVLVDATEEDFVWELLEDEAPELLAGRTRLGYVHFRRRKLELWELADEERRTYMKNYAIAQIKKRERERKREARKKREAKAAHKKLQRRERACLPPDWEPPEPDDGPYTPIAQFRPRELDKRGRRAKPTPRPPR